MPRVTADLNDAGTKIVVRFPYSPDAVEAVKEVPGRAWDKKNRVWTLPLSLDSGRRLREAFGQELKLTDKLSSWGKEEVRRERNLHSIVFADDAVLEAVREERAAWLRPYQRADVALMARANVINANQPGVGKTVEVIYAVEEAKLPGPFLVVAPITLHKDPWRDELAEHAPDAQVFFGSTAKERKEAVVAAVEAIRAGQRNVWLIINPEMVRVSRLESIDKGQPFLSKDHKGNAYVPKDEINALLFEVEWSVVTLDEFHKAGLGEDRNTLFARGAQGLARRSLRRYALSGTPMGGKPIRLWGALHFIEPEKFSAKWQWAEKWLMNKDGDGPVSAGAGTGIGKMIPGREDEFNAAHRSHMVRRTRAEALPGLPPKVTINVDCPMTAKQRKAYDDFAKNAEVSLNGENVSASSVLAEYARLKQFANALCEVRADGLVYPTKESGKLPVLIERLDGFGIRKDNPEPNARGIVASESSRMVLMVEEQLRAEGLDVRRLDGSVTGARRDEAIDWYKAETDGARVLVMTTQTGGVGLNLGMTDVIAILDETWSPDDQEQLEDRGMRNRTTPLTILYLRSTDSIQDAIWELTQGKALSNRTVLDLHRQKALARRKG